MDGTLVFFDTEVSEQDEKIHDIGAVKEDGTVFHAVEAEAFLTFAGKHAFLCGHNILEHDQPFLEKALGYALPYPLIDTLYLSALLFPERPHHALLKDDKLRREAPNDPVNDSRKAQALFYEEQNAYRALPQEVRDIYRTLLADATPFRGFFAYERQESPVEDLVPLLRETYREKLCTQTDWSSLIREHPITLAYALAIIRAGERCRMLSSWLRHRFPMLEDVLLVLCHRPCQEGCPYCRRQWNIHQSLHTFFGYDGFRQYGGEPLQEQAVKTAVEGQSLLAVFPTGGGKSISFQLPALMAARSTHALTVVISPLQSLMKDQVEHLEQRNIHEAVMINGLLDPIERSNAIQRLLNGSASLLYISPEQLRSKTIEQILIRRTIARFVIDEAHCFSAWGQDFRVDYLYIGDFIRRLQQLKNRSEPIPVSCFTATAKLRVIQDIVTYFQEKLSLKLKVFSASVVRENLHYTVLPQDSDENKYATLRRLITEKNRPTIVYVSRTKRTVTLAAKLTADGFLARAFHGRMSPAEKNDNQRAFIDNEIRVIVATSAFGMGVDKQDVGLVVHYDISDSLENYIQEAGRAGRDPHTQADCYILYCSADLDKHFILLNQTRLSIREIRQVWSAVKEMTRFRPRVCCSALELARQAGWDDSVSDIETRIRTAIAALENAGYLRRGKNMPHVYATGIQVKNMAEASFRIDRSPLFAEEQRMNAKRIMQSLLSCRSIEKVSHETAESRVDYLADTLGIAKEEVIASIDRMREEGLLADTRDMSAYLLASDTENKAHQVLKRFAALEQYLIGQLTEEGGERNRKELIDKAVREGLAGASVKNFRTLLYYLTIKNHLTQNGYQVRALLPSEQLYGNYRRRIELCSFILETLYQRAAETKSVRGTKPVAFSVIELLTEYREQPCLDDSHRVTAVEEVEDALLYLSKIAALTLEGGFLVLYNGMEIERIVTDNKIRYKVDDYRTLEEFYRQKVRQIHIVGEYARLMTEDPLAAQQLVQDYFRMDGKRFIGHYFKGDRAKEIDRNITPEKYRQLFGELSESQSRIIHDAEARYIVVAAGPGSGKTRVLVHKLAALLLMEDIKHEQLLMLTFSRAAATEFKKRLMALIGNAAHFVEIKTFHSYCFDLLGQIGSLEGANNVVKDAARWIESGEAEPGRITKSVLVIDEAQDMDENEANLVKALMHRNEDLRVIAVGDDDQNIYTFRGASAAFLHEMVSLPGAVQYEMTENYRSSSAITALANLLAKQIHDRMKATSITSMTNDPPDVTITKHATPYMYEPIAESIANRPSEGAICVLTSTNHEALQMQGVLLKKGIHARLIRSTDRFRLDNLAEVRHLLKLIDSRLSSPVIADDLWQYARKRLTVLYAYSDCLPNILHMMQEFETVSPIKYFSDLKEFIHESHYEDFYAEEQHSVTISTIHKAKGREFDTVYLLLNHPALETDDDIRRLYVGITRARRSLHLHVNTNVFDRFHLSEVIRQDDFRPYPEPRELIIEMTYKDVVLDYFKDKKTLLLRLRSGCVLTPDSGYLSVVIDGQSYRVLKCSKAFLEKSAALQERGYVPYSAIIRFIVAWKNEHYEEELPVLLADVVYRLSEDDKA